MKDGILNFLKSTGIAKLFALNDWYLYLIMYAIIGVLFYLAIVKKFEPLLLVPIAFGMILANLPGANMMLDTTGGLLGDLSGAAAVAWCCFVAGRPCRPWR